MKVLSQMYFWARNSLLCCVSDHCSRRLCPRSSECCY